MQDAIPIALRRTGLGQKHRIKLPFAADNHAWLQDGRRSHPVWVAPRGRHPDPGREMLKRLGYWELPTAWFNNFVDRALIRYGRVYIIQPFRAQEVCAPACQTAQGHECQCSCMGESHGAGSDGS